MVTRGEEMDTIHIELSVRRSTVRRALAVSASLVFFVGMGAAMALPSSTDPAPTSSSQGTNLERRLAAVEKRLTDSGQYTVGATFCGATSTTFNGNVGGYAAGKALCQPSCGNSTTAHVCVTEEIVRSVATGGTLPFGWYTSGTFSALSGSTQHDCKAWSSSDNGEIGAAFNQFGLFIATCDTQQPILCCD